MKEGTKLSEKIDIYVTLLIGVFWVITVLFFTLNLGGSLEGFIMLTVLMLVGLISYYVGKTGALITSMITNFLYCTYQFYKSFVYKASLENSVYFWIVAISLVAFLLATLSEYIINIQMKNKVLEENNERFVLVDDEFGVKNGRAFLNELGIYINLNKRHKIPVTLVLVRIRDSRGLEKILGTNGYKNLIKKVSDTLYNCLRLEDGKYILDKNNFAYVLATNEEGAIIIKNRMKSAVANMEYRENGGGKEIKVELGIGMTTINDKVTDALTFIKLADKELKYDV